MDLPGYGDVLLPSLVEKPRVLFLDSLIATELENCTFVDRFDFSTMMFMTFLTEVTAHRILSTAVCPHPFQFFTAALETIKRSII